MNRVADATEAANHHPDILVHGWNKVRLTLTTHPAGGLTDADREMAQRIDGPEPRSAATMAASPDERRRPFPK